MERIPLTLGRFVGVLGMLICVGSAGMRATGAYWLGGVPLLSIFMIGLAGMVAGSFLLLLVMTSRARRG